MQSFSKEYLRTLLETKQVKSIGNLCVAYGKDIILGKKKKTNHIPFPHIHFRNLASTNDSFSRGLYSLKKKFTVATKVTKCKTDYLLL